MLQSRPITTTRTENPEDLRPWYMTLRRSFENLKVLRAKIEQKILPEMEQDAARMADMDLAFLSDRELAQEILERSRTLGKWNEIYRRDCIPFAHGMRLFGQAYNDVMQPQDPFEFMELLGSSSMESLERNRMLETMAIMLRETPDLAHRVKNRSSLEPYPEFVQVLDAFQDRLGVVQTLPQGTAKTRPVPEGLRDLLLEMAYRPLAERVRRHLDIEAMRDRFLSKFPAEKRHYAEELMDLGRASYRLRDDDNLYLGKVEAQMARALEEGKRRLKARGIDSEYLGASQIAEFLMNGRSFPEKRPTRGENDMQSHSSVKARQIVGQPTSQGIAMGEARVIRRSSNLFEFKAGEVLVCDAVDPNMTFVVPLASAIVERRGGMLIHGAIIAREYGIPCVTGVPNAVSLIKTGDRLTVDGYLGIVIIG